jgi:formylmethanofuran dehydrogenase subunit E
MMKMKTTKQRMYTKELEEAAVRLHGQGGPFMVIGLRMGLEALKILDAKRMVRHPM